MSDIAISVEHLSKTFTYYANSTTTIKSALVDLLKGHSLTGSKKTINVLDSINFQIGKGEFVGIMGRNGAGKSTILKLLAGIYEPTKGRIVVNGNVAPMIELGAGFHLELSGYENIFLNSAILGFGRKATLAAIPNIIEFSELGDLIHMPVKNYSSGMLVRLGFSIASHLSSDIIIVDEVLAVGDISFAEKCIKKVHQLHQEGRTIILVTHSPEQVVGNCSRTIVIDRATVIFDGSPSKGVNIYKQIVSEHHK